MNLEHILGGEIRDVFNSHANRSTPMGRGVYLPTFSESNA